MVSTRAIQSLLILVEYFQEWATRVSDCLIKSLEQFFASLNKLKVSSCHSWRADSHMTFKSLIDLTYVLLFDHHRFSTDFSFVLQSENFGAAFKSNSG